MEEVVLFKIDVDVKKAEQAIIDYQVQLEKLKRQKKEIEEANKRGELSEQDYAKKLIDTQNEIKKVSQAQKEAQKQIELATKVQEANKNSYQSLTLQYAEAKKALNQLENAFRINADGSIELTEEYKKQAEEVKKLKDAIIAFDQNVSAGQTNVGNYTKSFKDAIAQTKIFGVSVGEVQNGLASLREVGVKGLLKSFIDLSKAIIASPLGVLLITVGALVSVFSKSKSITGALEQAFNALGQALNAVFIVLEPIIEGFASLISFGADALSGLVSFLTGAEANASKLNGELQTINDNLDLQVGKTKELNAEAQKQKNIVEDTSKAIADRLEAARKQFELEAQATDEQLVLEKRKAEILAEQLKTMGNTNERFEKQKELSEQNAKVQELIEQREKAREELIKKTNELLREQKADLIALSQAELNLAIAEGKIKSGSLEELRERQRIIRENAELQKQGIEDTVKRSVIEKQAQAEILQLENEFNKKIADKIKEQSEKYKELASERIKLSEQTQKALIETEIIAIQRQIELAKQRNEQKLQSVKEGTKAELDVLTQISAKQLELQQTLLQKQREQNEIETKQRLTQLDREAKELQAKGIDTRKFVEAERNRILQESLQKEQALQSDFANKTFEIQKNLAEKLKALRLKENEQALNEAILALQNQIALKKQLGEQDVESEIELAKTENSLKLEQLRERLANEQITQKEFDELALQAKIEYGNQIDAIEEQQLQRQIARINKQAEIQRQVVGIYRELGEAIFNFAEQTEESQKAIFVLQKTAALAEVAINLQRELAIISANQVLNADPTQTAKLIAIGFAIARGAKIIAEIKKTTFAEGGYTGDGNKYDIAGIVHRGEYVIPKWQVDSSKYKPIISILEQGRLKGYATGGGVGVNPIVDANENFSELIQAIRSIQPVVDVREIVTTANRVQIIENRASL